ncbi:nitrite reductase small subunit NirD [Pseudomonas saudiphocaensis]|uniref:nitrite reductase small subunit NirD n=1 Tax=Pseudomonas saudiphocaensis TaxID=1499686 RepID=UPI00187D56CF|nr:nitrite reductase small subunit NirD [Pseudomonas saudiphocaensis]MBE7927948.1 nitrite reductase small subunit NirD [Pseudomonas saudiphocaensis]
MSQSNALRLPSVESSHWHTLCSRRDLVANSGVVAWLDGKQVALIHLPHGDAGEQVFAVENRDPKSGANVIGRGIVGKLQGELVIASPLYKRHFSLTDGRCLEYPDQQLQVWPARLNGDAVEIAV